MPSGKKAAPTATDHETDRVEIGPATVMPEGRTFSMLANLPGLTAADFQAKQDSIGTKRRGPGERLTVKLKTRAKPSDVPETDI